MKASSIVILILAMCAVASAQDVKEITSKAYAEFRLRVDPPCDPRSTSSVRSPCTGRHRNSLPGVKWSTELEAASRKHVVSCPLFYALPSDLPADTYQTLFLFPGAVSAQQLVDSAFAKWKFDGNEYDPVTGYAYSGDTLTYKALVSTTVTQFACALKLDCAGGPTGTFSVLHCLVREGPPEGPAYPPLIMDASLQASFKHSVLKYANLARYAVSKKWHTRSIKPLVWSDQLAALAAEHVATLRTERVYRNGLKEGESVWASGQIHANGAGGALVSWFKKGIFYSLKKNTCSYRTWGKHHRHGKSLAVCGEFTQLVHQDVKAVGCAQAWYEGCTFVVCNFDFKAADGRKHISPPVTKK